MFDPCNSNDLSSFLSKIWDLKQRLSIQGTFFQNNPPSKSSKVTTLSCRRSTLPESTMQKTHCFHAVVIDDNNTEDRCINLRWPIDQGGHDDPSLQNQGYWWPVLAKWWWQNVTSGTAITMLAQARNWMLRGDGLLVLWSFQRKGYPVMITAHAATRLFYSHQLNMCSFQL